MFNSFLIRAAQIDLNRQPEPVSFIHEYIDFLADNNYNMLQLYIGWRVNIESHPFEAPGGSFTRDEIKAIVDYAHRRNLKVIPSTDLTYVNSLKRYPEMAGLMEDGTRFWGDQRGNFCVSNSQVYEFLEKYLTELAEIIPSDYFHIGGDEAWDTGYCKNCMPGGYEFARECQLYKDFILKIHDIVVGKLKRRMIMWDDMFEYYPSILNDIPHDVIMAHWQYENDAMISRGHFGNRRREKTLEKYDELGFQYIISAATGTSSNARTFTEYAQNGKNLLGGLMTTWVTHRRFMFKALPTVASAGRLWAHGGDEAEHYRDAMTKYLGTNDALLLATLRSYSETSMAQLGSITVSSMVTFGFNGPNHSEQAKRQMMLAVLRDRHHSVTTELGSKIVDEVIHTLEIECAIFDLKIEFNRMIRGCFSAEEFTKALENVRQAGEAYAAKWEIWRPGIMPNHIADWVKGFVKSCTDQLEKFEYGNCNYVRILFASPNRFGAVRVTVTAIENGVETVIGQEGYRGDHTFFERFIPLEKSMRPEAIRISVNGYCGQGVSHVAMRIDNCDIAPHSVIADGKVYEPDYLLIDDRKFTFIGDQDMYKTWHNRELAQKNDSVTVNFVSKK